MTKILALVSTVAALAVLGTSGMASAAGRDHRDGAATSTAATPAKQGLAALIAKENFVANQHVAGAELAASDLRGEPFCGSKTAARH